jgi:PKHD-type hydroxylase
MIHYLLNKVEEYKPVLSVDNFFTVAELQRLTSELSKVNVEAALAGAKTIVTNQETFIKAMNETHAVRKSNIHWCVEPELIWVYDKLAVAINHVNVTNYNKMLYGIEALQYTEYDSKYKGFYKPHVDADNQTPLIRSLSFTMQLSREDEYKGGEVLIYHKGNVMAANKTYGSITFFESSILHEVTPVTSGFRKSLVGWIHGPRV